MNAFEEWNSWLEQPILTEEERDELKAMTPEEKEEAFYKRISFGTAGLRGIMGLGTARMNRYTVRHAAIAIANTVKARGEEKKGVCVCYDCRHNSRAFAETAAEVLAGEGIPVYFFNGQRPTPVLSFAVRRYGCAAGINFTASHNPKEYNGCKVYGPDGGQLGPEPCAEIADCMNGMSVFGRGRVMPFHSAVEAGTVTLLGKETDEAFLQEVLRLAEPCGMVTDDFSVVYTPFHGTGAFLIPEALRRVGVKKLYCVEEQMIQDGDFSTVKSPNPEYPESFALAVAQAKKVGADLIIGSDPDADRLAMLYRSQNGEYIHVTGNLTGALLLDWYAGRLRWAEAMPEKPVVLKSLVTTELLRAAAEGNGCRCEDTFTGFKYLAETKNRLEAAGEGTVIFSCEESYGCMAGDYCRDKDAVTAAVLLCLMASDFRRNGKTPEAVMESLYRRFGYYREKTVSLTLEGIRGIQQMEKIMNSFRKDPPGQLEGLAITQHQDFLTGTGTNSGGDTFPLTLAGENVLRWFLADGSAVVVRPSGTEPKLKLYLLVRGENEEDAVNKLDRLCLWTETVRKLAE